MLKIVPFSRKLPYSGEVVPFKVNPPVFNRPDDLKPSGKPEMVAKTMLQHRREVLDICRKLIDNAPHIPSNIERIKAKNSVGVGSDGDMTDLIGDDLSNTLSQLHKWETAIVSGFLNSEKTAAG